MPKKTRVVQNENDGPAEPGASSAEAKIDKVKARRLSTSGKNGKPMPRKRLAARKTAEPRDEEIRLRAYFISERRRRFGLPGDASSDWLEAKRQLLSESGPR